MKFLFIIFLSIATISSIGQTKLPEFSLRLDTCKYGPAAPYSSSIKGIPIYVVNGIINNSGEELNPDSVSDVSVLSCPASFKKFGHIGWQNAIVITTTQQIEAKTLKEIQEDKKIEGEVIFALNSLLINDITLKIAVKAIIEIEVVSATDPKNSNAQKACINIWTLPKEAREKYLSPLPN